MQHAPPKTPSFPASTVSPFLSPYLASPFIPQQSLLSIPSPVLLSQRRRRKRKDRHEAGVIDTRPRFDPSHPEDLTRRQLVIFVMYCWGFFALGLFTSAPGPILPTLMAQVNVSLATISFLFSARAVGFVVGSIISGYVMDLYQKYLIAPEQGTQFLLKKEQKIVDYLWSLPKWSWPLSSHNVFSISIIIAGITNAAIPYVSDVYSLSVLVIINGVCFGNINTFGNVLLLTLFDVNVADDIDFQLIYGDDKEAIDIAKVDNDQRAISMDVIQSRNEPVRAGGDVSQITDDEQERLMNRSASGSSYGSTFNEINITRTNSPSANAKIQENENKGDERVGPYMQALQAIYALGGLLAPILIQVSFQIDGTYDYAFWLFTLLYFPPGIVLLFYPEPIRMSVVSARLKQIEFEQASDGCDVNGDGQFAGFTDQKTKGDVVQEIKEANRQFWAKCLCAGFAIFLLWYVGAQVGYGMYITTYCMDYLKTSPAMGRYVASANWGGLFVGRFVAVPLSKKMSALNMVRFDLIGMTVGCFLLFYSTDSQYVVWISSVLVGFCMASVWPSMFVWAESLMPVTGVFASIMVGGGSLGEFVIPAAQGNVMAALGSGYFVHVMFSVAVFLLINFLINRIIAKRLTHFS